MAALRKVWIASGLAIAFMLGIGVLVVLSVAPAIALTVYLGLSKDDGLMMAYGFLAFFVLTGAFTMAQK